MQNEDDKENQKETINSSALAIDREQFKYIAEKYKTAVNEVFQEIFKKGLFDIKLKNDQSNQEQGNVEKNFLEMFLEKYSERLRKIQEEENHANEIEVYPLEDLDNRRKDVFVRTLIYYMKKKSPNAKALFRTKEIEDKINISQPVILGLLVFLSIGSNMRDKKMMEEYCDKYSYLMDGEKLFHWGGNDDENKGIFDDENVENLADEIISNLANTVSNIEEPRIISLIKTWLNNNKIKVRDLHEDEVGELLSVLKGIAIKPK
ncbi:MAG TPA: hypothetical protein QF468_02480 [Nitrospinota bacterium]|jgi:hypothetical protein|nr:hypothetical protein [Nitrospinota bacterium]|tara:strand:- start:397 stop:1182 length:786 start_codon:yes stop_codon:yes gene_type:complete